MFSCWLGFAQPNEVSLVVVGEGPTKEEATNNALRSAIEQAFGVFVSANTAILNDELVRDEIATITSGNIKSYRELNYLEAPGGEKTVTLQAVVSIGNLIAYSKSHGSSAEFAGAIFGANLKLRDLNKQNEEKVLKDFLLSIRPELLLDARLSLGEPMLTEVRDMKEYTISYTPYNGYQHDNGIRYLYDNGIRIPSSVNFKANDRKKAYRLPITISYYPTAYAEDVFKRLKEILFTLSIKPEERAQYDYEGEKYYLFKIRTINDRDGHDMSYYELFHHFGEGDEYAFRSPKSIRIFHELFHQKIVAAIFHVWAIDVYAGNDKVENYMWSPIYNGERYHFHDGKEEFELSVSYLHSMPLRDEEWLDNFNTAKRNSDEIQKAKDLLTKHFGEGTTTSDGKWTVRVPVHGGFYRLNRPIRGPVFVMVPRGHREVWPKCIISYQNGNWKPVHFPIHWRDVEFFDYERNNVVRDGAYCATDVFSSGYTLKFYFPIDRELLETITEIKIRNHGTEN